MQERGKEFYGSKYVQLRENRKGHIGDEGKEIDLVCSRPDGSYINPRVTQHVNQVVKNELEIGLFDFHTLRHTHATMLLEAGASPVDVQDRLGHSKLAMTWKYTHNTEIMRDHTTAILETLYR